MGVRNFLILFFSSMAVSLVILIIFFSLFFQKIDFSFDTKMPESAPDLTNIYGKGDGDESFKADGVVRSTVNVPNDHKPQPVDKGEPKAPSVGLGVNASDGEAINEDDTTPVLAPEATPLNENVPELEDTPSQAPPKTAKPEARAPKTTAEPAPPPAPAPRRLEPKPSRPATDGGNAPPVPSAPPNPEPAQPKQTGQNAPATGLHQVYIDGFSSQDEAHATVKKLQSQGLNPIVKQSGSKTVVQLGTFSNRDNASDLAEQTGAKVKTSP